MKREPGTSKGISFECGHLGFGTEFWIMSDRAVHKFFNILILCVFVMGQAT